MPDHRNEKRDETAPPAGRDGARRTHRICWHNWCFLAALFLLTTFGMSVALLPLVGGRIATPWPWLETDLILVIALTLSVISCIAYLSKRQRGLLKTLANVDCKHTGAGETATGGNPRLKALSTICFVMESERDIAKILDFITNICVEIFNCQRATLMMLDRTSDELEIRSVKGQAKEGMIGTRQKLGDGIAGWAAKHRQALLLGAYNDLDDYPGLELRNPSISSALVVPIIHGDDLLGILNVTALSSTTRFTTEDLQGLQLFLDRVSVYVSRAEQSYRLQTTVRKLQTTRRKLSGVKPVES